MTPAAFAAERYTDVSETDWYYDEIDYVTEQGLMDGVTDTTFDPGTAATRADVMVALYRMEGSPEPTCPNPFPDVAEGDGDTDEAIVWASCVGLVTGYPDGTAQPDGQITRQELATLLYRYYQYKGYDLSASVELPFDDADEVGDWALTAMKWAVAEGIFSGVGNNLVDPQGTAERSHVAALLYKALARKHTVTFDANWSRGEDTAVSVADGETVTKPANPTRSGYSFGGWYTKSTGGTRFSFSTPITEDLTLYARWYAIHYCSYGDWTHNEGSDPSTHTGTCSCGDTQTEACTWTYTFDSEADTHDKVCSLCDYVAADDTPCSFDASGKCECGNSIVIVAAIGNVGYTSAQEALDAAKDGDTIELLAGNHGDLVFRVNEDSELVNDTYYYMSNYDSSFYGRANWQYAKRTISNLTITGVEGAIINSFTTADARDDDGNVLGTRNNMFEITNLKISNLTIADGISFNTSNVRVANSATTTTLVPHLKLDGLTIDGCKTTTDGDTTQSGGRVLLGIGNTGFASNAKNIVVTHCIVTDMFQGVYLVDGENVRIEDNSFSGLTHNSIHVNKHCSGTITISGNTIDEVTDRPIRFNGVQSGTVTISNNTITNSAGDNGQYFKASAMGSAVALTWENNTIDGVAIALTTSGTDTIGVKSTAKIDDAYYATAQEALDAATDGDTIELFAGNHGDLVFRVNESSTLTNYYYYMSNYQSNFYGQETWRFAMRTINGLTITGGEDTIIGSFTTTDARDDAGNAKETRNNLFEIRNLKISGITIADGVHFNTSDVAVANSATTTTLVPHLKLDGLTIDGCKTTTDGDTTQSGGRVLLGIGNTGSASNAKNITVTGCAVTDMFQGVYLVDGENVKIESNSFSGLTHNSIHVNKHCSGTITISGNTINSVSDRPIRFNGVQSGTVTISNNTITNSAGDNGQYFKASAMGSDVTMNWTSNTADETVLVLYTEDTDIIGVKYANKIEDKNGNWFIYDTAGLKAFRDAVNGGNNFSGKTVKLMNDINLDGEWTPIGTSSNPFSGTFDGDGKTVSNLKVSGSNDNAGFFGYTTATVKNLTIDNAVVSGSKGVGAISGLAYTGTVSNCHVTGTIQITGNYKVGGITGGDYSTVTGCSVIADANSGSYVKGVWVEGDNTEGDNVGGIMGYRAEASVTISGCTASIDVEGTRKVGGIVGSIGNGVTVSGCTYTGNVKTNADSTYATNNAGKLFVGGIVGEAVHEGSVTITGCTVSAGSTVTGKEVASTGAVLGGTRKAPSAITITITDCTADDVTVTPTA